MKLTKSQLKALIKEELSIVLAEEEAVDLSKLEPIVDKAAKDVISDIQGVSKEESVQRMMLMALIAKLNDLAK